MKKFLYLILSLVVPLSYAMESGTQRHHPNEVDCWQKHELKTIPTVEMSCRSSARETDAVVIIEQIVDGQKKEQTGMSHQTYSVLSDAINNAKICDAESAKLHEELRSIINRLPYSQVVFHGLTQEIKDKLQAGDLRVIMPGFIEQDYPQFFADNDHPKIAGGFLNGIKFQERMNAALAEQSAFEQKINALPKKTEATASSEWLKPHIIIPAGILAVAVIGLVLWEQFIKKHFFNKDQKKKPVKKQVRFKDEVQYF